MRLLRPVALLLSLLLSWPALARTIPAGTPMSVRFDATVSSSTAQVGDIVPMSLASDLVVDGRVLARRGHPLRAVVTYARRGGRFHKPGYVTVRLKSIRIRGRRYRLHSTAIRDKGDSHTESNVTKIGGGTGVGALIGGIAGGGKGALIGGLLGAGAGTGLAAATGHRRAELPAEAVYNVSLIRTAR